MKMRLPNGHVVEFRVEHRAMMDAAKVTHDLYEKIQKIDRETREEHRPLTRDEVLEEIRLFDEIRDIHGYPARKWILDRLLSDKGRKLLEYHERERRTPHLSDKEMTEKIASLTY